MRRRCSLMVMIVGLSRLGCNASGEVLSALDPVVVPPATGMPVLVVADGGVAIPSPAADVFVSAGQTHSCALVAALAYCWGNNNQGQLGVGDMLARSSPSAVVGGLTFRAIRAATLHTCALDDLGAVYCWGDNPRGQLGTGDRDPRSLPVRVDLPGRAAALASRFAHSCALLVDGSLQCWGQNGEGELGQADLFPADDVESADALSPIPVDPVASYRAVGTGQGHTCGIRLDGTLWCWGRNSASTLGVVGNIQIREPVQVGQDADWLEVFPGQSSTCALKEDSSLWCWGENVGTAEGEGAPLASAALIVETPVRIAAPLTFAAISTNTFHTCGIERDGELHCWGRNIEGQLGLGDLMLRREPSSVGTGYARISAGRFHSCVVRTTGAVECAGDNSNGQLGLGDEQRRNLFTVVR